MKQWRRYACGMLFLTLAVGIALPADADELTDRLSNVQTQMEEAQRRKELSEMEIGSVSEVLRGIQTELDAALAELHSIESGLDEVNAKIAATEAELAAAEARLQEREKVLNTRLRNIYMHGKLNYIEVVMGSKSFSDFVSRLEFLKRIVAADLNLITEIHEQRAVIVTKKELLEDQRGELANLQKEAQARRAEIESRKADQLVVMARLENEKALAEQSYAELQSISEDIAAQIRARQQQSSGGGSVVSGSGVLIWPVSGPITSPFGYRTHPIFGTQIFHAGIDIGVDWGTPVAAADSGTVMDADWLGGYGYAVIIDHGNGLSTLYGHNSELLVTAGQTVQQGEIIAYAGSTGYSTGPHVHFEVRVNGDPVDPLGYL